MQNAKEYRTYAEECERLARQIPVHRQKLLRIAEAWRACAVEAEKQERREVDGGGGKRLSPDEGPGQ